MTRVVLDASAVLAFLRDEPGADRVDAVLDEAVMLTVNLAEVASHYAAQGASDRDLRDLFSELTFSIVAPDADLAFAAALLRPLTARQGLSLADRFCLALAQREGVAALTADRIWADTVDATGVAVELIR